MERSVLVADIGATTTRTAFVGASGALGSVVSVSNREAGDLSHYLAETIARGSPRPRQAVLAVAGPVDGEEIAMTNHPWRFSRAPLSRRLGIERLVVLNDFAAAAHAVPLLATPDLMQVQAGQRVPGGAQLICGPGTGFGVAVVHHHDGICRIAPSEAGHMRLGATNADEARILAGLEKDFGATVIEHILSGAGIARLHFILHGRNSEAAAIISDAAEEGAVSQETVAAFLRIFGRVAGDLALAFEVRGGIFLAGGIARSLAPLIAASPFLRAFREHPPYEARLDEIPVHLVLHSMPGLLGAASIARRQMAD